MNRNAMHHQTWRELWQEGCDRLIAPGGDRVENPRLDASLLLSAVGGFDRTRLFTLFPEIAPEGVAQQFETYLKRRISGEPVSYILGRKEFWGLDFLVGPQVLTPRPDTETLVEAALEKTAAMGMEPNRLLKILDLCCGSGCIGIAFAHEMGKINSAIELSFSDMSREAITTVKQNAGRLLPESPGLEVSFFTGSLFDPLPKDSSFHIIASNPPYLTEEEVDTMVRRGWKEPELALRGGEDGLDLIRTISDEAFGFLLPGGYLFIESASSQTETISRMLRARGYEDVEVINDLAGRKRVSSGRRPEGEDGKCSTVSRSLTKN
jgi:release factor glutamine methyltransferase